MDDSKQSRTSSQGDAGSGDPKAGKRKAYRAPELIEYGSVAKLTQGTLTMMADAKGGGFQNAACL